MLHEGLLERVQLAVLREPLDGRDASTVELDREGETGVHGAAVGDHGAGAAVAGAAALLRPGEAEVIAEDVQEPGFGADADRVLPAVGYGMTETSALGTANAGDVYQALPDSVGQACWPLVELRIVVPEQPSDRERELYTELSRASTHRPRG